MAWLWTVMRPWSMPILRTAFRIRVEGRQYVPRKGAAIMASNHLSALDHIVLPAVTRRTIINISKAEHFDRPLKAWFFRQWGVIKLQRGASDQTAMDAARAALRDGNLFCIYPEGTRSRDGKLHRGHTGVARLALEMCVPVIPVAMKGTYEAKPKGGKTKFFHPTAAIVGAPLDFSHLWGKHDDKDVCRAVTDQVMHAIAALSGQEYVDEYQENPDVKSHRKPNGSALAGTTGSAKGSAAQTSADLSEEQELQHAMDEAREAPGKDAKDAKDAKDVKGANAERIAKTAKGANPANNAKGAKGAKSTKPAKSAARPKPKRAASVSKATKRTTKR